MAETGTAENAAIGTATVIGVIEAKEIEPRLKKAKTWNESSAPGASPG